MAAGGDLVLRVAVAVKVAVERVAEHGGGEGGGGEGGALKVGAVTLNSPRSPLRPPPARRRRVPQANAPDTK